MAYFAFAQCQKGAGFLMLNHPAPISPGMTLYLGTNKIVVLKVYGLFQLVRVRYENGATSFCIDKNALTDRPDNTPTINLNAFQKEEGIKPI